MHKKNEKETLIQTTILKGSKAWKDNLTGRGKIQRNPRRKAVEGVEKAWIRFKFSLRAVKRFVQGDLYQGKTLSKKGLLWTWGETQGSQQTGARGEKVWG